MTLSARLSITLSKYLAKRFLAGFVVVLAAVGGFIYLAEFLELLRRSGSRSDVPMQLIFQMALLKLPHTLEKVVPFAVLFGGMHTFWRLTRSSELVVARASGISVWQFLAPPVLVAGLVGTFFIAVINPMGSAMLLRYEQLEAKIAGRSSQLAISPSGMWLVQSSTDGQSIIHARRMMHPGITLEDVTVYNYDTEGHFTGRLDADEARLAPGEWQFKNALVTAPDRPSETNPIYRLPTDWTEAKIKESFSPPETLSFWQLPGFIDLLDRAGFTATRHRVYWHSLLAIPVMLAAMVLIAASFSLRMARRGGVAILIASGTIFSFFILFLSDIVVTLGLSSTIPALLAAWTPAAVTGLIGMSILLHLEEG